MNKKKTKTVYTLLYIFQDKGQWDTTEDLITLNSTGKLGYNDF